jgi:RNA polymerase sigma-70 factor (ECF subfamily)
VARSTALDIQASTSLAPLAERTRAGDPAAFRALIDATSDRLYRLAVHLLRDPDEAEDVVQETYIRAWERRGDLRDAAAVVPWLARIARNAARDRLRWWKRRPERPRVEPGREPASGAAPADRVLMEHERAADLRRALDVLPEKHRVILLLREVEEMSYEQIAELLGVPLGTVDSRLHRARAALGKSFAKEEQ